MDAFIDILAIIGMFFLRLGVPLLLVVGVGYLLLRLDARWEAEAREQAGAIVRPAREQRPEIGRLDPRPIPAGWPLPQRLPATAGGAYASVIDVFGQPCWALNGCDETARQQCPAYHQPGSACWLARFQADGRLPDGCPNCPIFAATSGPALAPVADHPGTGQGRWLQ